MFEVKFDDLEMKESITNSKLKKVYFKKNLYKILIGILIALIGVASTLFTFSSNILTTISIVIISLGDFTIVENTVEIIKKLISKNKREKANDILGYVTGVLNEHNIYTNSKDLSDSVIIENSYTESRETVEDGVVSFTEKSVEDTYYLFLNNELETEGLLERKTSETNNDETTEDRKIYILEKPELEELSPKITTKKRLVKVKTPEK